MPLVLPVAAVVVVPPAVVVPAAVVIAVAPVAAAVVVEPLPVVVLVSVHALAAPHRDHLDDQRAVVAAAEVRTARVERGEALMAIGIVVRVVVLRGVGENRAEGETADEAGDRGTGAAARPAHLDDPRRRPVAARLAAASARVAPS